MREIIIEGTKLLYETKSIGSKTTFYEVEESVQQVLTGSRWSWKRFTFINLFADQVYHKELFWISMNIDSEYKTKKQVAEAVKKGWKDYLNEKKRKEEIESTEVLIIE